MIIIAEKSGFIRGSLCRKSSLFALKVTIIRKSGRPWLGGLNLGGPSNFMKKSDKILLKPNFLAAAPPKNA